MPKMRQNGHSAHQRAPPDVHNVVEDHIQRMYVPHRHCVAQRSSRCGNTKLFNIRFPTAPKIHRNEHVAMELQANHVEDNVHDRRHHHDHEVDVDGSLAENSIEQHANHIEDRVNRRFIAGRGLDEAVRGPRPSRHPAAMMRSSPVPASCCDDEVLLRPSAHCQQTCRYRGPRQCGHHAAMMRSSSVLASCCDDAALVNAAWARC